LNSSTKVRNKREPDELFEAIAELAGFNLKEITASSARVIGKTKRELLEIDPNLTRVEVLRRGDNLRHNWKKTWIAPPTLSAYWSSPAATQDEVPTGPNQNTQLDAFLGR
jgi:hypothetical protein